MKRRFLSLLLALCLIVSLLPMAVLAEDAAEPETPTEPAGPTASLVITTGNVDAKIQWAPALSVGMAPAYAKTTAAGALVLEGATENDYNLKVEWAAEGTPTLTMKDATLTNDHIYPNKINTIEIGGSANFIVKLDGANVINGNPSNTSTTTSAYRAAYGIEAENDGTLTICGDNRDDDSLTINNKGGNGISRYYNALTIDKCAVIINCVNTASNAQNGIVLRYEKEGLEDQCNLTVTNAKLDITAGSYHGNCAIMLSKSESTATSNVNACTGDILFKDSIIRLYRNNGTGSTQVTSSMIALGSNSTLTIDNCDTYFYTRHVVARYAPELKNVQNAYYKPESGDQTDWDLEAGTYIGTKKITTFKTTHICTESEPFVRPTGECSTTKDTVTVCTFCGVEMSKQSVEVEATKIHNPGAKVLLNQVDAQYEKYTSGTKEYYRIIEGTYTWQYTCAVCSASWTEEENFKPATLNFISSGEGSNNQNSYSNDNTTTGYGKTLRNPGYVAYYVTKANDDTHTTNSYMVELTDAAEIAAGNWNVKFEYPVGGNPTLTLKNATIINNTGLWYGYAGFRDMAPLTVVLEGANTIKQTLDSQGVSPFMLQTNNAVTINGNTGSSLFLGSYSITRALGTINGDLTMNDVNLTLIRYNGNATSTREDPAIGSTGTGNVTINGGSINYVGFGRTAYKDDESVNYSRSGYQHLIRGNNITLNNANITAHGTFGSKAGIIYAKGNLAVNETTLFLVHGFAYEKNGTVYGDAFKCGGTATFNYANGVAGKYSTSTTYVDAHVDWETITYPTTYTDITATDKLNTLVTSSDYVRYLEIAPVKELVSFTGTAVTIKDDLDISFKLDAAKVDVDGTVKFTVNGTEITKALSEVGVTEGDDYVITLPGLSAKQMRDQITVTIYDAEGNALTETKSDSVQAYALRLLRGSNFAADTAANNALKTFVADMLVYGAMAQIQFGQPGEALVTNVLTPSEWNYVTAAAPKAAKTPAAVTGNGYISTTFELKSNIGMFIALDATVLTDVASAKVTFTDYLGNAKEFAAEKDATSNEQFTIFAFNELAAANGRQDITWTFYNAENEVVLTVVDSLANYVSRARADYPYTDELLKYCDSAKAYFTLANAN